MNPTFTIDSGRCRNDTETAMLGTFSHNIRNRESSSSAQAI